MDDFRPFSAMHAAVLAAFAAFCALSVWTARRHRPDSMWRERVERFAGFAAIALFLAVNHELWLRTERFDLARSLPLHVCDLSVLMVPLVLIKSWRPARALLYYFGLGLSSQGFFTPDLNEGPSRWPFWSFWLLHFAVVGTAIYDLGARGFRPTWRDLRLAVIASLVYVAAMLVIDVTFGWNYGYVGPSKPQQPTLIDALGPWPWRVGVMVAIGIGVMALLTIPWTITGMGRKRACRAGGAR